MKGKFRLRRNHTGGHLLMGGNEPVFVRARPLPTVG